MEIPRRKKFEEGTIRFCGREITQDEEGNIKVKCKDTVEKTAPVNFRKGDRTMESPANEGEISQLRSVVGSLSWVARQCRPSLSYDCSRLQSVAAGAQLKHLVDPNKTLAQAIEGSEEGFFFKAHAFNWNEAILVSVTDASWAGETLIVDDKVFPRRSQRARVTFLASPYIWTGNEASYTL